MAATLTIAPRHGGPRRSGRAGPPRSPRRSTPRPRRRAGPGGREAEREARGARPPTSTVTRRRIAEQAEKLDRDDRPAGVGRPVDARTRRRPQAPLHPRRRPRRGDAHRRRTRASTPCRCAALAAELQAPTMTLYYYVRTKDELLSLIVDAVMAEVVLAAEEVLPEDWKEAMVVRRLAHPRRPAAPPVGHQRQRGSVDRPEQRAPLRPVAAGAGRPRPTVPRQARHPHAVDEYVFGYCSQVGDERGRSGRLPRCREYVEQLVAEGSYPQLEAVIDELGDGRPVARGRGRCSPTPTASCATSTGCSTGSSAACPS